jgi:prepilin-type N-terminal cleavage/methylation domain-containing protein
MIDTFFSRRARLKSEGGFTLIELIVVMALSTVVLGAMLTLLYTSQQVQAGDAEWAQVVQKGRAGLGRMAHEIRQASEVKKAEKGKIEFLAIGQSQAIAYNCTEENECQRTQSGKSQIIIEHVLNGTEVFSYSPTATESWKAATAYAVNATVKTNGSGYASYVCIKAMTSGEDVTPPEATHWRLLADVATLRIELSAAGTLKQADFKAHQNKVVLENAAFMRNLDLEG